ncbi:DUF4279 domain-containing protein [Psychrobacillus sp. PGGUH221]|uniref:DUF4279 domain-containing protein n=1 Tax=Psychrobacillus sp. PGGUH221 TaxID=3020058 RepID=UPI0035C67A53
MEKVLYVGFRVCSLIEEGNPKNHFNPKEISKLLGTVPTHQQEYQPNFQGNPRELIPGTSLRASWIYHVGGKYEISSGDELFFFVEELMEQLLNEVLTEKNRNHIKELRKRYNFTCELHIHHFTDSEYINLVLIPENLIKALADIDAHLEFHDHKKPINEYRAYDYKKIFEL